jgi:hypothetical protein
MSNMGMCEHHNLELIRIHNRGKMLQILIFLRKNLGLF